MKILVIGGGAREHALAGTLARETSVSAVICAPGNAGIAQVARCLPVDVSDPNAILELATRESVDLTVVGPELPLARGVADTFHFAGCPLFGPSKGAARLESSKAFAKDFMVRHAIPTARFTVCSTEREALTAVRKGDFGFPVVVKADGLAAGKGVTIALDLATAEKAVRDAMVARRFGDAGATVLIEECLAGPEVSYFVLSDGRQGLALPAAQDHKRVADGDHGPNTGGMGAFAPSPLFTAALEQRVMREIVMPTLDGMRTDGHEYRGVLYVGLMLTTEGPKVIEFNVRFGDPEAQVLLPMIESELGPVLAAVANGNLGRAPAWRMTTDPHVGVVMASGGYPGTYETGIPIDGLEAAAAIPGVRVFHAGTADKDGIFVTSGGRVLTIVARSATFAEAIEHAYQAVNCVSFRDSYVRTDIGQKGLRVVAAGGDG